MNNLLSSSFGITLILIATAPHAVSQLSPTPDPLRPNKAEPGNCNCTEKLLPATLFESLAPTFDVLKLHRELTPKGFTTNPPVDEWSGDDELYRIADARGIRHSETHGTIRASASQNFEIYGGFFTPDSFPANHTHPTATIQGEFEFKTDKDPYHPVGLLLSGNLIATGNAMIEGNLSPDDIFWFEGDVSTGSTLSIYAGHPRPHCVDGDLAIDESAELFGSIGASTETTLSSFNLRRKLLKNSHKEEWRGSSSDRRWTKIWSQHYT